MYLPKLATAEQACTWLENETGEAWSLVRLLESHLLPHFWLDSTPEESELFEGKPEGFLVRMVFTGDTTRLQAVQDVALVQMYMPCAGKFEGKLLQAKPGIPVPLSDLRFRREDVHALADAFCEPRATKAPTVTQAAQTSASDDELREKIHEIAHAYIAAEIEADRYPTQETISEHVDRELRERGIMGKRGGPLSGAYIKRHYLKGISVDAHRQALKRRGK